MANGYIRPKNITKKLLPVTKITINPVNKEIYEKNRWTCGSCPIYSIEYIWTNNETIKTGISILTVNSSK